MNCEYTGSAARFQHKRAPRRKLAVLHRILAQRWMFPNQSLLMSLG